MGLTRTFPYACAHSYVCDPPTYVPGKRHATEISVTMTVEQANHLVDFSDAHADPFLVGTGPVTEAIRMALIDAGVRGAWG